MVLQKQIMVGTVYSEGLPARSAVHGPDKPAMTARAPYYDANSYLGAHALSLERGAIGMNQRHFVVPAKAGTTPLSDPKSNTLWDYAQRLILV